MIKAGGEEKALAIANNDYHDDIPAITVVCDGGWSKRSFVCLFVCLVLNNASTLVGH